ncbi:MAG: O-antigen export system, permease protein [Gemmatimonadetes bacterium]|nr:O-antigen export system, permease protein [Gemmatimonadota bacterium]
MSYSAELWQSRELVMQFALRDLRLRYKEALMGWGWAILMPVLIVFSGVILRSIIARAGGQHVTLETAAEIAVKAVPWAFFASTIQTATQSLVANRALIGKVYFAREAIPLGAVAGQMVDLVIGMAMALLVLVFAGHIPTWSWLWTLPLLALLVLSTTGVSLLLSCANLFFRDVRYVVGVVMSFGIFATPIYYTPDMVGPTGARLLAWNPLSAVMLGLQRVLVQGSPLLSPQQHQWADGTSSMVWTPWMLSYTLACGVTGLAAGLVLFRRYSAVFAEWS